MNQADLIQAGGVLAFAGVVLFLLRRIEPLLSGLKSEIVEMRLTFAALLERERIRDEKRRRETMPPPTRHSKMPSVDTSAFPEEEKTDLEFLIQKVRKSEPMEVPRRPRGEYSSRPGTNREE